MSDTSSSNAFEFSRWADFWIETQRRYWDSWANMCFPAYGNPLAGSGVPNHRGFRVEDFWFGLMTPPRSEEGRPAPGSHEPVQPTSAFGSWADVWFEAQRSYWKNWVGASRQLLGADTPSGQLQAETDLWPWVLDFWTRLAPPMASEPSRDWVRGALEANRFWFRMGEQAWKMLAGNSGATQGVSNPWDVFGQSVRQMQESFTANLGADRSSPWAGFANFWGMPLDNWRRVCSAFSMLPGDMEKAVRGFGSPYGPETLHQTVVGVLSMPTVGYTREWQEELQRWGLLWLEHSRSLQAYGGIVIRIIQRAFELFGRAIAEKAGRAEALGSLREFYNLWIDSSEEAYAEISVSREFIDTQTRLTNSLFAIKRQEQKMVEEVQSALNMPTRRELDTSHRRVHELQRRLWQVEQLLEESGGPELRKEVSALRRELEALRTSVEAGAAKPAISRRSSGLKTTT